MPRCFFRAKISPVLRRCCCAGYAPLMKPRRAPPGSRVARRPDSPRILLLAAASVVMILLGCRSASAQCAGDCNGDGRIVVSELVRGVNILLGRIAVDACPLFDANGDGTVAINELVRAVGFALGGCPAPDIVLEVVPGALLLPMDAPDPVMEVRAYTSGGDRIDASTLDIEWQTSDPVFAVVAVEPDQTLLQVANTLGAATITARLAGFPEVVSPLVSVVRASLHPDAQLIPDSHVIFPPEVPAGVDFELGDLADIEPADADGEASFGGFTESEIAALMDVSDELVVTYPVVLRGEPPMIGERLVGAGSAPIAGIVRSVETRGDFSLVQIEVSQPQELFEAINFEISAEELISTGQLQPFDSSPWESDAPLNDEAALSTTGVTVGPFVCKPIGLGVVPTFTQIPSATDTYFGPIWDGKLEMDGFSVEEFFFKIGVIARASFRPEIRLTSGVAVQFTCDLSDANRIKETIPVSGPLSVLLAPYVEGLITIPVKANVSGGATSRYGVRVGFDLAYWAGGTYTSQDGWIPLCPDWQTCSRNNHEAEVVWESDESGSQLTIEGDSGGQLAADVGVQAGGTVFDKIAKIPGLRRVLNQAARVLQEKGKVPVLRGRVGPIAVTRWHNARRTAFIEASEAAANLIVRGDLRARFDSLNSYLVSGLGLAGVRSLPLLEIVPFQFSQPYRILREETLTVGGRQLSTGDDEVVAAPDTSLQIVSTVERDFVNISLIELFFADDTSPHTDFPSRGEVWIDGAPVAALSPSGNSFTLSGSLEVTPEICAMAETEQVEAKIIAYNEMFSLVPTSNYVGRFRISCDQTNMAPVVDAGPDMTVEFPGPVTLNGMVSDDGLPDPPGELLIGWNKAMGIGTVEFADPLSPVTTATFSRLGTFVLELIARDFVATTRDEVVITVVEPAVAECDFDVDTTELFFDGLVNAAIDTRGEVEEDRFHFGVGPFEGGLVGRSLTYEADITSVRQRQRGNIRRRVVGEFRATVNANCTALESYEVHYIDSNREIGDPSATFEEVTVRGADLPFRRETNFFAIFSESGAAVCDSLTSLEYRRVHQEEEIATLLGFSCDDISRVEVEIGSLDGG